MDHVEILLVEDNDDFRFYLKDNLVPYYKVIEAENGQQAWEWLQDQTPDLIISDVMMPHMDGIELTKRVKNHPPLAETPVVLLTAMGDEEMQLESYRLGVSDYIQKPFTFELLASRIKNLLAQKKQAEATLPKYVEMNPSEVEITPADEIFLKQVLEVVEKNMGKPEFTVEELYKFPGNGQADTRAGISNVSGNIVLEKPLKDLFLFVGCYTDTSI